MQAMVCACGEHMVAADDEALFRLARAHAACAHPELQLTDAQIHRLLALDTVTVAAPARSTAITVVRPQSSGLVVRDGPS